MTYTHGFNLHFDKNITKSDFFSLCENLNAEFGTGNIFEPEPITDGFLIWKSWPSKKPGSYKCIRLKSKDAGDYRWPWINPATYRIEWNASADILIPAGKYTTFLKALDSAPSWTKNDLQKVQVHLEGLGCRVTKVRAPPRHQPY